MKNNTPSSEFEHEDKCPSCGSPCNIHTDLDENDECNECRSQIDTLELGQIISKKAGNIPTAEEFLKKLDEEKGTVWTEDDDEICIAFKEFAKLHVQAALKAASKQAKTKEDVAIFAEGSYRTQVVDKESILNSYPLENIK